MSSKLVSASVFLSGWRLVMARRSRHIAAVSPPALSALFSTSGGDNQEWRKTQLDKLRRKFEGEEEQPPIIESDEELQPMWKEMESRVVKRRSRTLEEAGEKVGRSNIRRTDEEAWLHAGMYDQDEDTKDQDEDKEK